MLSHCGRHASLDGLRGDGLTEHLQAGQLLLSLSNGTDHDVPFQGGVISGCCWYQRPSRNSGTCSGTYKPGQARDQRLAADIVRRLRTRGGLHDRLPGRRSDWLHPAAERLAEDRELRLNRRGLRLPARLADEVAFLIGCPHCQTGNQGPSRAKRASCSSAGLLFPRRAAGPRPDFRRPRRLVWKIGDAPRVLYRLPQVLAAINTLPAPAAGGTSYGHPAPPSPPGSGQQSDRPGHSDPRATAPGKIIPNKTVVHPRRWGARHECRIRG